MPNTESVTYYWPGISSLTADGTLVMRATGYDGDCRWTGEHRVTRDDPDYRMWCRFSESFSASPPLLPFVSSEQLDAIREEFLRENPPDATPTT
jgi:hypothetical protein